MKADSNAPKLANPSPRVDDAAALPVPASVAPGDSGFFDAQQSVAGFSIGVSSDIVLPP